MKHDSHVDFTGRKIAVQWDRQSCLCALVCLAEYRTIKSHSQAGCTRLRFCPAENRHLGIIDDWPTWLPHPHIASQPENESTSTKRRGACNANSALAESGSRASAECSCR